MDVILKVLEGAKTGTKIAVKKDEFLIGRSQKSHLCAGSSSVSRHHCTIMRKDATVSIKDLGSRNGTLVNGEKISEEVVLSSGDEIGVGTLKLLVTITHGITNLKRPKVKTVADAVERAVATSDSSVGEEDITQWLLDAPSPKSGNQVASETQTIRMDDTNAVQLREEVQKHDEAASTGPSTADDSTASQSTAAGTNSPATGTDSSATGTESPATGTDSSATGTKSPATGTDSSATGTKSPATGTKSPATGTKSPATGTDSNGQDKPDAPTDSAADQPLEEKAKTKKHDGKKKEPGKLPPRPHELGSKDSREAAMQALRNWNRRR